MPKKDLKLQQFLSQQQTNTLKSNQYTNGRKAIYKSFIRENYTYVGILHLGRYPGKKKLTHARGSRVSQLVQDPEMTHNNETGGMR